MIQQQGQALTFYAFYTASKMGKTGLTVTVDVFEGTTGTPIVSAGNASELADGLYYYSLSGGSVDANACYLAVFKTADATVDTQHIPALWAVPAWVANVDAKVSTRGTLGVGSTATTVTVNDGVNPLDGVDVWVSTDAGGANVIARGTTNASGQVTFMLDAGTYYCWKQLAGYTFTNPQTLVVV
jgi:hypothetical protein